MRSGDKVICISIDGMSMREQTNLGFDPVLPRLGHIYEIVDTQNGFVKTSIASGWHSTSYFWQLDATTVASLAHPLPPNPAQHIVVTGNPVSGLSFIGPFASAEAAEDFAGKAEDDTFWPALLEVPHGT